MTANELELGISVSLVITGKVNSTFVASTEVSGPDPDQPALENTLREILLSKDEVKSPVNEKTNTLRSQASVTNSELDRLCEANVASVDPDDEAESLRSDVTNLTNTGLKILYLRERNQPHYRIGRLPRTTSTSSQLAEISSVSGTQSPISEDCVENWEYFAEAVNDLQNCLRDLVPGEAESELAPPQTVLGNTPRAICVNSSPDKEATPPIPERKVVNTDNGGKKAMDYLDIDSSGGQRWSLASSGIHDDDECSKMTVYGVPDSRVERQLYSVDGIRRSSFETVYHPPEATEQLVLEKVPEPVPLQSICVQEVVVNANEPRSPEMRRRVQATGLPTVGGQQIKAQPSESNPTTRSSPPQSTSLTTSISTLISSPTSNLTTDPSERMESKSSSPETTKTLSVRSNHDYESEEVRPTTSPHQAACCATAPPDVDSVPHSFAPASSVPSEVGGNEKDRKGPTRHTLYSHPKPTVHARLQSPLLSSTCRQSDVPVPSDSPARLSQLPTDTPDARKPQASQCEPTSFNNNGDYDNDEKSTLTVPTETTSFVAAAGAAAAAPVWTGSKIFIKANSPVPRKPRKSGIYKRTPESPNQTAPTASPMWTEQQSQLQGSTDAYRTGPLLATQRYASCRQDTSVPKGPLFNGGHANSSSRFPVRNFNSYEETWGEGEEDLDKEWVQKLEHIAKWQREVHQAMQNMCKRDFCVSTSPPLPPMESVAECPVDVCLEGEGIPIRAERYDDARRMNPRAGPQVASYYEEAPDEVHRPSHPTTPGTNGVSHLDPHNQTQTRVSRQPQLCFAQSTSNPTRLTLRQADDIQHNMRQPPRTTNCTVNYTNGAARKNRLEQADPTAFLRRDNFPQVYTTNSGATFVPNNSVSLTKIPDAVPFSSRSTFPMPPAPVAYNFRQDRETLVNQAYPGSHISTQLSNNWPEKNFPQPSVPYNKSLPRQNPMENSSKPVFARRNQLSSTVLQRPPQPNLDLPLQSFHPSSFSPIQSASNTLSPQSAYAEALSLATAATAAVEAAVNRKAASEGKRYGWPYVQTQPVNPFAPETAVGRNSPKLALNPVNEASNKNLEIALSNLLSIPKLLSDANSLRINNNTHELNVSGPYEASSPYGSCRRFGQAPGNEPSERIKRRPKPTHKTPCVISNALGYQNQNFSSSNSYIHCSSGEKAVNTISVNLRPPGASSTVSPAGFSLNARIPGSVDGGIHRLGQRTTQSASPAVMISEKQLRLGERRSQSVGPSLLPPPADANLYPLVTDLSRGLRAIQGSVGNSSDRTPVQALRPQKFILGRISSNEDICIQTETPFAFSIASTGKNICIAKVASADDLKQRIIDESRGMDGAPLKGCLSSDMLHPAKVADLQEGIPVSLRLTFGSMPCVSSNQVKAPSLTKFRSVLHMNLSSTQNQLPPRPVIPRPQLQPYDLSGNGGLSARPPLRRTQFTVFEQEI